MKNRSCCNGRSLLRQRLCLLSPDGYHGDSSLKAPTHSSFVGGCVKTAAIGIPPCWELNLTSKWAPVFRNGFGSWSSVIVEIECPSEEACSVDRLMFVRGAKGGVLLTSPSYPRLFSGQKVGLWSPTVDIALRPLTTWSCRYSTMDGTRLQSN
jgi:hypothetical protein